MPSFHFHYRAFEIIIQLLIAKVRKESLSDIPGLEITTHNHLKCRLELYKGGVGVLLHYWFAELAVLPIIKQYSTSSVLNCKGDTGKSRLYC